MNRSMRSLCAAVLVLFIAGVVNSSASPWNFIGTSVYHKSINASTNGNYRIFIGYAGWNVTSGQSQDWVDALFPAYLRSLSVVDLYAVGGPHDPDYNGLEIANSKLIADLVARVKRYTGVLQSIVVAGHSSGSFVAHEFLNEIIGGYDPIGITKHKVIYFNLDGGMHGLSDPVINNLITAYFVYGHDNLTATFSPNHGSMTELYSTYLHTGKVHIYENDSSKSKCTSGAVWCVHISLINQVPWDHSVPDPSKDYVLFNNEHPVTVSYLSNMFHILSDIRPNAR